jgi:hypothetical protein
MIERAEYRQARNHGGKAKKQNKKQTFKTPRKETQKYTHTIGQITYNEDKKSSDTYDARD